jgi:hypothetical protein
MAKYLILWEGVPENMPTDPGQRATLLGKMMEMTKKSLDDGDITEWGIYSDGSAGYAMATKDGANCLKGAMQFMPYYKFSSHEVLSLAEVAQVMQSMPK